MVVAYQNYILNVECPRAVGANAELIHHEYENRWNQNIDKLASLNGHLGYKNCEHYCSSQSNRLHDVGR